MIKRISAMLIVLILTLPLSSCGTEYQQSFEQENTVTTIANGYFTVLNAWSDAGTYYYIAYANDTKVKYFIRGMYVELIMPLRNSDGTLQIYGEEVH